MVATMRAEKLYQSSALVRVDPDPVQVLPNLDVEASRSSQYDTYMETQAQVLSGRTLLLRVAERLAAEPDSGPVDLEQLASRLSVSRAPRTQAFVVSYRAPQPETAARVANLFAEEFIGLQYDEREATRQEIRDVLGRELALAEQRIQESETQLVAYAQEHDIERARPDQGDLADQKLSTLAAQVTSAEADLVVAKARAESLQNASVTDFPAALVTPLISDRMGQFLDLEHRLTELRASFGENWPDVVRTRDEMALLSAQLDREKNAALAQAREQIRVDLRAAEQRLALLNASRSEQARLVSQLQSDSIQYNILQRQVETNRKLYEGLLERLREISVTPGIALGTVRIMEPARPSVTVASPQVWWNLFLSSVLGLSLGVSIALGRDFWRDSLSMVEDVEESTGLSVLAAVPLARARAKRRLRKSASGPGRQEKPVTWLATAAPGATASLGNGFGQHPEIVEAVRTLCASLLLSRSERPPRVVVVTSCLPGEGKTTIVSELGRALAENGVRTLLVECDLRRSGLSRAFGIDGEGGLSLFLSGHIPKVTVHQTDTDKLFVVGSGPIAPNPAALLNSEKVSVFLRDMAASFQFVILDTTPVMPMADARILGSKADGVVLVVRSGKVSRRVVRRARTTLEASGSTVLGAVLNGVAAQDLGHSYDGYYQVFGAH
jgi:capsular exopolysaccharide synthesis family protein